MKNLIMAFLFSITSCFANEQKYFLAVCGFFKNESRYLKEWIEYHRIQGVEKFYLYNNSSTDDFYRVLKPYMELQIVELFDWPNDSDAKHHVIAQTNAYRDCISRAKNQTQWVAFIDIDEFIVPTAFATLRHFIESIMGEESIGSIEINWQLYGTSALKKLAPFDLVTEKFIMKAQENFDGQMQVSNHQFKSIVRPEAVKKMTLHYAELYPDYKFYPSVKKNKEKYLKPVDISQIRINHYWTRDEEYFINTKIQRRKDVFKTNGEIFKKVAQNLNAIEDRCIYKFLPELKERVFSPLIYD